MKLVFSHVFVYIFCWWCVRRSYLYSLKELYLKNYDRAKVNEARMWYLILYYEVESTELLEFSWIWTASKVWWLEEGELCFNLELTSFGHTPLGTNTWNKGKTSKTRIDVWNNLRFQYSKLRFPALTCRASKLWTSEHLDSKS